MDQKKANLQAILTILFILNFVLVMGIDFWEKQKLSIFKKSASFFCPIFGMVCEELTSIIDHISM